MLAAEHDEACGAQMVERYKRFRETAAIRSCTSRCSGACATVEVPGKRDDVVLGIATGKSRRASTAVRARRLDWPFRHHPDGRRPSLQAASLDDPAAMAETGAAGRDGHDRRYDFDMAMARAAGVGALGVAWGYHEIDVLRGAGAHAVWRRATA